MSQVFKTAKCKVCKARRKVSRPRTNHILHLLLSVVTCGLWLLIWIGVGIKFGGWRCEICGSGRVSWVR